MLFTRSSLPSLLRHIVILFSGLFTLSASAASGSYTPEEERNSSPCANTSTLYCYTGFPPAALLVDDTSDSDDDDDDDDEDEDEDDD